jgi:hypothetical protein
MWYPSKRVGNNQAPTQSLTDSFWLCLYSDCPNLRVFTFPTKSKFRVKFYWPFLKTDVWYSFWIILNFWILLVREPPKKRFPMCWSTGLVLWLYSFHTSPSILSFSSCRPSSYSGDLTLFLYALYKRHMMCSNVTFFPWFSSFFILL